MYGDPPIDGRQDVRERELAGPDGRIAQAIERAATNPNALARMIGELRGVPVTPSTVYGWVSAPREGKAPSLPGAEYLTWLPEALNVDGDWLLTGEGSPERRTAEDRDTERRASAYDRIAAVIYEVEDIPVERFAREPRPGQGD